MGIQYLGMSGGSAASFNVLQNGNIGVGTTTPWASLSIQGGLDPYDLLDIASSTSATTAARVFTILANGKVGIGTSTPTTTLDVAGDITDENIKNCDSSSQSIGTDLNGKLVCNTSLSDERLKNDITTLDASSTLAAINQLNPVSFYWKDNSIPGAGSTQEQFGFIAQDVENIFPNLVGTTTATTTLTPDFTYYLNYQGFIALAVKGIQALSAEVAGLQTQVAALQASVVAGGTNAANALGDFFANRIHTQTLCIGGTADGGETCITRSQLDALLQSQGLSGVISNGAVPDAPSASSTPSDSSSTSTDSTDASSTPDQSSGTSTPDMSASSTPTVSDSSDASDTIATSTTS